MIKSRAIALGVVSGFVIAGGVILCVLLHQIYVNIKEGFKQIDTQEEWDSVSHISNIIWVVGLVYVIPGLLGIIAAFAQIKCLYVTTFIFSMISLLIMGFSFIFVGFAVIVLIFGYGAISEACMDSLSGCQCRVEGDWGADYSQTPFRTCSYFNSFIALYIAIIVFIILSWAVLLGECILACYYACSKSQSTHGVVYTPAQQPMVPMNHQYSPPQYTPYPSQQPYFNQPPGSKA